MTMQIRTIAVYGKNGERRDIDFQMGKVNIVTGASKKGKSSLLDITEYCLGASESMIPESEVFESVAWYAIVLSFPDTEVFIARASPLPGAKASSSCHLIVSKTIRLPESSELENSTNIDSVTGFLTTKLGIPEQTTEVPSGQTRSPITIAFKHSRYYLFQSQGEVATNKLLFHRQSEPHIPQAIKDTLSYFLGAAEDGRLNDLARLRELKRDRTSLVKRIKEIENLAGEGFKKAAALLAEAAGVGLDSGSIPANDDELLSRLVAIRNWTPQSVDPDHVADPLFQLEQEKVSFRRSKNVIRQKIRSVSGYESSLSGFASEVNEQSTRLQSIGLFEALESTGQCPVCDQIHEGESHFVQTMRTSANVLERKLEGVQRDKPRISQYVNDLKAEDKQLAAEIKKRNEAIEVLRATQRELTERPNVDAARMLVIGRISLYLESTQLRNDTEALNRRISEIEPEIQELEDKLDPESLKEKLDSQLSLISEDMTAWARELQLEHSEHPVRLDMRSLNVAIEKPHGRTPLYKVGSGENWVGYHLVAYLALAKWFIEQKRPVGSFIFFDQPTQVYFPSEKAVTGDLNEIKKDEDREAVKRMFRWIFDVVDELSPNLQVIITDHADINEDWFQEAVVDEKWRDDKALIPKHWYEC